MILSHFLPIFLIGGLGSLQAIESFPVTPKAFKSTRFEVEVNGQPVFVHKFKDIHYTQFPHPGGDAQIRITPRVPYDSLRISPKARGVQFDASDDAGSRNFVMVDPGKWVVTLNDNKRLFLFAEDTSRFEGVSKANGALNVIDFGADSTGKEFSTQAIQRAIDEAGPGRRVRLPAGHYLSGSLNLKSGVTLWLDPGALLQAVGDPSQFDPEINGFIQVKDAENVKLAGLGTIDGSGAFLRHLTNESGRLIFIRDSLNVEVEGLILRNPRAWNTHIVRSERVTFRDVKLVNDRDVSNTDGINPDSSRHVLIEDSFFYCGDDSVAVKSTNRDGKFLDVYDIVVRNNVMLTKKSALKVGTESHAPEMRDIRFENNDVIECDRGMSLYARDGTHMHNIRYIDNRFEEPYPDYQQRLIHFEIKKRNGLSRISNVLIQNCQAEVAWPETSLIRGFDEGHGISGVVIDNLVIAGEKIKSAEMANLEVGRFAEPPEFK